MDYFFNILVFISIYIVLAVSLDLIAGQIGILSIAHAGFYGLGAYTSALLTVYLNTPFLVAVLIGMAIAAVASLIVSLPSLRLHEDYFVIATFGFQIILFSIFNNWVNVTRGPLGIPGIPPPSFLSWTLHSSIGFVFLAAIWAFCVYLIIRRLSNSPYGRVLRAIREDEVFAQAMGKNTLWFKVTAFAISAALAASAGSLYAHFITYIDPSSFTVMESILIISMVIIGGADSPWGPAIGALILIVFPEVLRFVGFPNSVAANLRQIFYGLLLVIMMMTRPNGLLGRYRFRK
jgi:branched-chain amino acid transport system permease protein